MLVLLLVLAFVFFAAIAPIETTIAFSASVIVTTFVVKLSAKLITGDDVSFIDALKAIGLSTLFVILAYFGLIGLTSPGGTRFEGTSAVLFLFVFFISYIAGFSVALKTSFGHSAIIALISSLVSSLLLAVIGL